MGGIGTGRKISEIVCYLALGDGYMSKFIELSAKTCVFYYMYHHINNK